MVVAAGQLRLSLAWARHVLEPHPRPQQGREIERVR